MQRKRIFMFIIGIIGMLFHQSWLYSIFRGLEFDFMKNIKTFRGGMPKPSFEDDNDSHNYVYQDRFQHYKHFKDLGDLVQRRLHKIQNPVSCNMTRKIKCVMHGACGFGCQASVLGVCLMIGYATNRTVTIEKWVTSLLQPLSTTCTSTFGNNSSKWQYGTDAERFQVIELQPNAHRYKPRFYPPAIPEDLADKLVPFHDNPFLWWAGQISAYFFRPTNATTDFLKEEEARLGFSSPIAGVHIRRTDKLRNEAKYHHVDEYMVHVDKWYDNLEWTQPGVPRRLFVATDDPGVKQEIQTRYPKYEVMNNDSFTRIASNYTKRKTKFGYLGIISDVYMLSKCDYLVCTFSSNVCRLAYQLMQSLRGNATRNAVSVDHKWHFFTQNNLHGNSVLLAKMPLYGDPNIPYLIN